MQGIILASLEVRRAGENRAGEYSGDFVPIYSPLMG